MAKRRRVHARVIEAKWTAAGTTVQITYDGNGVKHGCMNPLHGARKAPYHVLHLVKCPWKNNVKMMTSKPRITKSKPFQYCHKLCPDCLAQYGPRRCFKCDWNSDTKLLFDTVVGDEAITSAEDFVACCKKWSAQQTKLNASFLVLHCTVLGREAQHLRHIFNLKGDTMIQIVYSDVRERTAMAGSGINLEASQFKDSWMTSMKEKVRGIKDPFVAFYGNVLLSNHKLTDLTLEDVLVMYMPNILDEFQAQALPRLINTVHTFTPSLDIGSRKSTRGKVIAPVRGCCLENTVVHSQRQPLTLQDQCLFEDANYIGSQFYKSMVSCFGAKVSHRLEHMVGLGQELRIGVGGGDTAPFHNLYMSRGGEVKLRLGGREAAGNSGTTSTQETSESSPPQFEVVCWTKLGSPSGGEFVIPGLLLKFATDGGGSAILFRPNRYYHATLPTENRDLRSEMFAVAFIS